MRSPKLGPTRIHLTGPLQVEVGQEQNSHCPIGDPCEQRSWDLQLVPSAAMSFQKLQEAWGRRASQAHGRSLLWRPSKAVPNNYFSDGLVSTSNHLSLCCIQMGATYLPCFLGYRIQKSQLFTTLKSKPNNLERMAACTEKHTNLEMQQTQGLIIISPDYEVR